MLALCRQGRRLPEHSVVDRVRMALDVARGMQVGAAGASSSTYGRAQLGLCAPGLWQRGRGGTAIPASLQLQK